MNERRQDFELLQRFTRDGEQSAFADVVRRHLDLVFATALRKVADTGGAQEVAQNVFAALARKAWRFAPDDSLPAWLHKAALLESKYWLRGELGRRRREETAVELGTTMNTPADQPAFNALMPLLDEALLSLREKDRTALLLRFCESQSLRDVGAGFGVNEDAAQKRVQSALEKLAEFFKRRGYKTATVAATAAALQHTTTSASATMVSAVVGAALQAAPPALVGLSALIARLANMSRVQTAAVCVALAAVPVAWQLIERHAAGDEAKRTQTQLLAAQNEHASLQTEIERLRASSGRLEQSLVQANEAAARAAASAQAFEAWKQKTRGQLMASDYRWDDDLPFVRIPKAILPQVIAQSAIEPFLSPGVVLPCVRELMGLTASERASLEASLHRHFTDVEERWAAEIQETNLPLSGRVVASRKFNLSPPADGEIAPHKDQMLAEVRGIVGEERWPLVEVRPPDARHPYEGSRRGDPVFGVWQDLTVNVAADDKGVLKVVASLFTRLAESQSPGSGQLYSSATVERPLVQCELSMFLPDSDPRRTEGADLFAAGSFVVLRQRAMTWLQDEAITRLGKKEHP
jgi:RNA polymerase sigma factor (sigma-70 family)